LWKETDDAEGSLSLMTTRPQPPLRPSNAALAEALFSLSEHEPPGDRRVALLKAGYAAFDTVDRGRRAALRASPDWLRPLIEQLASCRGEDSLNAAVERLATDSRPRRRTTRERYLTRAEVPEILAAGPADLNPDRMRGAFHWHTTDSDGKTSLETMAHVCRRRGFAWSVVTDHSRGLEVASGLDAEGLRLQRRRVDRWNHEHGDEHRIFQGLEVEVLEDGTLDVPRGERLAVECVAAAVHRLFDPDRDQTERLLRAVATPGVHVLAHPRARHFHTRPGLRARWETVFAGCAEHGVAVEINGFPRRQDLDWELARLAADAGCEFLLASDAHAPRHLEFDQYAAAIAVKAEVPRERILNVLHSDECEVWLAER
jgi:histidinol phosphatase-like PHP family hydrolase